MAANSLGGLVVRLGLDAAEFTSALTKSERQAYLFGQQLGRGIQAGAKLASIAIAGMATAATATFAAIDQLAKQAGNFQDLAEKTGANAEALASFAVSATVAGTSMDEIALASIKLTKNLTGVDDEAKAAGAALTALGIPIKEFKALDPAAQMERLAKALAQFDDAGGGKTAVLEALAKGGAQLLPFFKELESAGGRQVILTQKQIELADEYADKQAKAAAQLNLYAQVAATQASGAILAVTNASKEFIKELIGVDAQSKTLRDSTAIRDFAENAGRALAFVVDGVDGVTRAFRIVGNVIGATAAQLSALASGDLKAYKAIQADASKAIDDIIAKQTFSARLEKQFADQRRNSALSAVEDRGFKPPGRKLNFAGADKPDKKAASDANAEARRILDGQIKALEASLARERDILNAQQNFLRDSFSDGYLSVADYYDRLQAARDDNLQKAIATYDREIAATKAFQATLAKASERQDAQNKIDDIKEKQANLTRESQFAEEALARERTRTTEQYGFQLQELSAKMLDLAGNTAKAGNIRFDAQNAVFNRSLQSSGNTDALAQNLAIRDAANLQNQLNDRSREYQLILGDVSIAQERINIAQTSGAIGEIAALNRSSELARANIGRMTVLADAMANIARQAKDLNEDGSINIVKLEQLQRVEEMRVGIERLATQTTLLKDKFNNIIGTSFSDAIFSLAEGTKSFKEAAKDLGKSITSSINKIASDQIANALFGKEGALSGAGGILAKMFGATGDTAGAAAGAAGAATTTAAATALTGSAGTLTASAGTITGSAGALTGSAGALTGSAGSITGSGAILTTAGGTLSAAGGLLSGAGAALTAAAGALTAAAAASGASSIAGAAGSFAGLAQGGGLAHGSNFTRGGPTLVGERGPEIVNMPRGAQVIPNDVLRQKRDERTMNLTQNINVMPGADTRSSMQAANMAAQQARRAWSRNG